MRRIPLIILMVLMSSLALAQTEKTVVRRVSGGAFKPIKVQYYDPNTAQWLREKEWNAVYGYDDLSNYWIVPVDKVFNGERRKVSLDKNFAIAGGTLIGASVIGYVTGKVMSDKIPHESKRYKMINRNLTVMLGTMSGIGALTILLGINVSYEGVPIGNNNFIDTSGAGIKYTKKF